MTFKIIYHEDVVLDDIPKIQQPFKDIIKRSIEKRLTAAPEQHGKPLRRSLKGYRRLRVGDYRVVFRIQEAIVKILAIRHRKIIYQKLDKRLK